MRLTSLLTFRLWTLALLFAIAPMVPVLAEEDTATTEEATETDDNPYLPGENLTAIELKAYIEKLLEMPATIQKQEAFSEAVVASTDRLVKLRPSKDVATFALLTKMATLHRLAVLSDENSQAALLKTAEQVKASAEKPLAEAAAFYLLENRALQAGELKPDELPPLAEELLRYMTDRTLEEQHLRLCSATVAILNRLEDNELAQKLYAKFGSLWANSKHPELSRYGKKIAKGTEKKADPLVGKPMPLAGATADGKKFDIAKHRGKVVVVFYWAFSSPASLRQIPMLMALHKQFNAKGLEIVGVNIDDEDVNDKLEALSETGEIPWPNIIDISLEDAKEHPLAKQYKVEAVPTLFLVDKAGVIAARNPNGPAMIVKIEKLLKADAPAEKHEKPLAEKPKAETP